jgi:hypothetical protein
MTHRRRLVLATEFVLSITSSAFSQWEWAGGIPINLYSAVGATGRWIFLNWYYAGDRMAFFAECGGLMDNIQPGAQREMLYDGGGE